MVVVTSQKAEFWKSLEEGRVDFGLGRQMWLKCGSFLGINRFVVSSFCANLQRLCLTTLSTQPLQSSLQPVSPFPPTTTISSCPALHTWRLSHSRMLFGVAVTAGTPGRPHTDQRWPPHLGAEACAGARTDNSPSKPQELPLRAYLEKPRGYFKTCNSLFSFTHFRLARADVHAAGKTVVQI